MKKNNKKTTKDFKLDEEASNVLEQIKRIQEEHIDRQLKINRQQLVEQLIILAVFLLFLFGISS